MVGYALCTVGSFTCIVLHQPMGNFAASRGGPGWSTPAAAVLFTHGQLQLIRLTGWLTGCVVADSVVWLVL